MEVGKLLDDTFKRMQDCTLCELSKNSFNIRKEGTMDGKLPGGGGLNYIMFVGTNPSYKRSKTKSFVTFDGGYTGDTFWAILKELNIDIQKCYFTNTVKCSTIRNRSITTPELKNCFQYLKEEINIVKPKIIVTLGTFSRLAFAGEYYKFSKYELDGKEYDVFAMNHPASIRHDPGYKDRIVDGLNMILERLNQNQTCGNTYKNIERSVI